MKKIAYIYLNELKQPHANVIQVLNTVSSLGKLSEVTFFSCWLSKRNFNQVLKQVCVLKNFALFRMPIKLVTKNFFLEKITRFIYSLFVLIVLKIRRYDAIYARDFGSLYILSFIPRILRPNAKIFFESHIVYHRASNKVGFSVEKKVLDVADKIVSISNGIKKDLITDFKIEPEKIILLPDAVNYDLINKVKVDEHFLINMYPQIKKDEKVVLYLGSFKDWKGVDVLVEAISHLKLPKVKFLLIGGIGVDLQRIRTLSLRCGVNNSVVIDSWLNQDDVAKIYKSCDVAIVPNTKTSIGGKYTSPLKVFEYMSAGLPIISSDLPALRELLNENRNAVFFTAGDSKDLAAKIEGMITDDELMAGISKNNRRDVQRYTWDSRSKKILGLLK